MEESQEYQDLFPNYKIPRKKESDVNEQQIYTTPLNWGPPVTNIDTTGSARGWIQNITNSTSAPVTYNFSAYKRPPEKEVPKNVNTNKRPFLSTCPDLSDSTLPKELTSQFQPLFCKLCQAHLCSNSNAMLHYKSKNHDKKVKNFLIAHSAKTGEPLHKRAKIKKEDNNEDDEPRSKHCDVCDMDFTSKMHADQHYMGRNHHKALLNQKPPPNCILGDDGKWHRVQKVKDDPTGRNGIGVAFTKPEEVPQINKGKFHCSVCNVFATSQENLDTHYNGQKHKKQFAKLGGQKDPASCSPKDKTQYDAWDPSSESTSSEGPQIGAWEPIPVPQIEKKSINTCRTPSGQYYCQICNLTLNSESQFLQHLDSKKHNKNKQSMAAIKSSAH